MDLAVEETLESLDAVVAQGQVCQFCEFVESLNFLDFVERKICRWKVRDEDCQWAWCVCDSKI